MSSPELRQAVREFAAEEQTRLSIMKQRASFVRGREHAGRQYDFEWKMKARSAEDCSKQMIAGHISHNLKDMLMNTRNLKRGSMQDDGMMVKYDTQCHAATV